MKNLEILEKNFPYYKEKLEQGYYLDSDMPLLEILGKREIDLSRVTILACLHMLEPQLRLIKVLTEKGILPTNIFVMGKVYSCNENIIKDIESLGCYFFSESNDFKPHISFDKSQALNIERFLDRIQYSRADLQGTDLVVLDDGGLLIRSVVKNNFCLNAFKKIMCVEQTSSGKNILLNQQFTLPVLVSNVAGSKEKIGIETDYIVDKCCQRIVEVLEKKVIQPHILVIGLGPIGSGIYQKLSLRFRCDGYDVKFHSKRPNLASYNVIIGATGQESVSIEDLLRINQCILISVSSSDREFPAEYIRRRSLVGGGVHDDYIFNGIELVNGGFPVTFYGNRNECPPLHIDVTMMKMYKSIYDAFSRRSLVWRLETINFVSMKRVFCKNLPVLLGVLIFLYIGFNTSIPMEYFNKYEGRFVKSDWTRVIIFCSLIYLFEFSRRSWFYLRPFLKN